jgi:hypothetical protein
MEPPSGGRDVSTLVWTNRLELHASAESALKGATRFWFAVTVIGQWLFLYYIAAFYGPSTFQGNFQAWNKNKFLFKGYVPGDTAGNLAFAVHVLLAAVIAFGGALQLIPQIRARAIAVHCWNGRIFILTAMGMALSGFYMNWVRGARQSILSAVGTSLDGLLIVIFAALAWRTAMKRDLFAHRRWALRTYMAANGQWFIRVGLMAWAILFHGWHIREFFLVWGFGCYLFPLAVLELYLRTKENAGSNGRVAMAGGLIVLTLLTAIGIFGFTAFVWTRILSEL